jgi:hypothetical protein
MPTFILPPVDDSGVYLTTDTPVAALLVSKGFILTEVTLEEGISVFHIADPENKAEQLASEFSIGNMVGNISTFWRTYRQLLRRVKRGATNGRIQS